MGGGLFQLVAYGVEDLVITHNPEVTYFKMVFKRHTNFTSESIPQNFVGKVNFGRRVNSLLSKNGDLISGVHIQVTLPKIPQDPTGECVYSWVRNIGHVLIKNVSIEIGGQVIDKHYGDWLHIWNELTCPIDKKDGMNIMLGNIEKNYDFNEHIKKDIDEYVCYIPLNFWFCKSPNLALPLIALKYHEVKINVEFEELENCLLKADVNFGNASTTETRYQSNISGVEYLSNIANLQAKLYIDCLFLDKTEREMFSTKTHEYCIEQVQYNDVTDFLGDLSSVRLNFNHPIKELIWVFQYHENIYIKDFYNYTNTMTTYKITIENDGTPEFITVKSNSNPENPVESVNLIINGNNRFEEQTGEYTNYIQQYYYHTNISINGINTYSFALHPENIQPSGTYNFSKVEDAILENKLKTYYLNNSLNGESNIASGMGLVKIYGVNYNILKITGGMGGIVFSN